MSILSDQPGTYTLTAEVAGGASAVQADLDLKVEVELGYVYVPLMLKVAGR